MWLVDNTKTYLFIKEPVEQNLMCHFPPFLTAVSAVSANLCYLQQKLPAPMSSVSLVFSIHSSEPQPVLRHVSTLTTDQDICSYLFVGCSVFVFLLFLLKQTNKQNKTNQQTSKQKTKAIFHIAQCLYMLRQRKASEGHSPSLSSVYKENMKKEKK